VGKQRVQRLMQQHGIRARGKRRFRRATTDSRHDLPIAPKRFDRNFSPPRPDTAWAGDITYIATEWAWLYRHDFEIDGGLYDLSVCFRGTAETSNEGQTDTKRPNCCLQARAPSLLHQQKYN
jgi:hypothetical protein